MGDLTRTEQRNCRFPGRGRPAATSQAGAGRPPEYCDNSAHNRAAAWHARRRLRAEQPGRAAAEVEERPVDAARQRASELHGQVAGMIEHLSQQLQGLLEELRTVSDPEAVEAQIEAVTSQAAEQVATASARASRAEQAHRRAEDERAEADAAAVEASTQSEQLRAGFGEVRNRLAEAETERNRMIAELADVRAAVDAERHEAVARLADVAGKLTVAEALLVEAQGNRDSAVARADAAVAARSEAEERFRSAAERADAEAALAARAEGAAESARRDLAQLDRQRAELHDQVGELRGNLAAMTAQRGAAVHDAEREKAHGDQRVADVRASHEEENRRIRDELAELRGARSTTRDDAHKQGSGANRAEG